ncbi:MAG: hypothetical protein KBH39_06450 [Chitinophagales bacterium]|nr:hypothetical protein [Chitinophagales bacterium]
MQNSKMISLLRHFSQKELTQLGEFIASPFFNKDEDLILLFNYIKKFGPEFTSSKLDRKELFNNKKSGLVLDEKKLSYMMSDIVKLTEQFIRYNKFNEQEIEGYCNLMSVYNSWDDDKLYEQTMRKSKVALQNYPYRNAAFFYKEYLVESEMNVYFDRQKTRAYDESLQKAADRLDLFYLSIKLKYSCELINRQKLVAAEYELRLLKEISSHLSENSYTSYPSISIYYQILMTFLESDNAEHFKKLKTLLVAHADKFPQPEARDMYMYAQNYCIRKINAGDMNFLTESLNLYKKAIEKEVLYEEGFLSPWSYKNIVVVALRAGDTAYAEQFIKLYNNAINPKFRNNAHNYNLAYLQFYKGKHGEALELLNKVEFTDIFYALDSRSLQIKIYYELDEWMSLQSALEAFRVYLRRNKTLSENMKTTYSNLVKFIDKLSRIQKGENAKLEKLLNKIDETKQIADIRWLKTKVGDKMKG